MAALVPFVVLAGLGIAAASLAGIFVISRQLEQTLARVDGIYAGLARLGERIAGLESFADSARNSLLRLDGSVPEVAIEIRRLSQNIEEERKRQTEPSPEDWKSGEGAFGRMARIRMEHQRLEDESYREMLARRGEE